MLYIVRYRRDLLVVSMANCKFGRNLASFRFLARTAEVRDLVILFIHLIWAAVMFAGFAPSPPKDRKLWSNFGAT